MHRLPIVAPVLLALACAPGCTAPEEPLEAPLASSPRRVEREPLPNWATPEELALQAQAGPPPAARSTTPPAAGYRVPAEYESLQAVLMTYTDYTSMLRSIATAVAGADAEVWMIGGPSSLAGVPADQYRVFDTAYDSVWTRDYGPFGIFEATGALGIIDPTYRHYASRPHDDGVPCALASDLGAPCHSTSLILDGGNYMTDGAGNVFVTERIYDWNSSLSVAQVDQLLLQYLGGTTLHVFAYAQDSWGDPADGTGHIDMYAKLVAPCKVIVAQTDDAPFAAVANAAAAYFAELACPAGGTYTVYRVPAYASGGVWYTYTNSLIVNQTVILPGYSGGSDATARAVYQSALPGTTVTTVNSDDSIVAGGSIHCVTREIPATAIATGCGAPSECDLPNVATHSCVAGVCGIETCDGGWGDCSGGADDGCETPLGTQTDCASCGDTCQGGATCTDGTCRAEGCADRDGDGAQDSSCGGSDCHDGDATVHPGAAETCDRIDQDCDGQIDEDDVCGAGVDAGVGAEVDAGVREDDEEGGGCGCRAAPRSDGPGGSLLLAGLALAAVTLVSRRR